MRYWELIEKYDPDYREGPESTATHDGKQYSLDRIFFYAKFVPIQEIETAQLAWMIDYGDDDEERIDSADLTAPIIVTPWEGKLAIVDGWHRFAKALRLGLPTIKAKIIHSTILKLSEG